MMFKKFRMWLAGKILGGMIVTKFDQEALRQQWIKDQLERGGSVVLEYEVIDRLSVH